MCIFNNNKKKHAFPLKKKNRRHITTLRAQPLFIFFKEEEERRLPESRQTFEVAAIRTSGLDNLVFFSRQTGFSSALIRLSERLSITFTSNGKREFVPRDQVSPLLVVYCFLFQQIN